MKWLRWGVKVLIGGLAASLLLLGWSMEDAARQIAVLEQARPRYSDADVRTVAVVLTFEAQVFPEPARSQAFRAIAWTMRNRVATHYEGATGYSDENHLLNHYQSFRDHRNDTPDPTALAMARQVLSALTNADDETNGARHYVDNSYWTGTHEQTGVFPKTRALHADTDVQGLVDDGEFKLVIEWKSLPGHPRGLLFYGLYFFDGWPPPEPPERAPAPLYRRV